MRLFVIQHNGTGDIRVVRAKDDQEVVRVCAANELIYNSRLVNQVVDNMDQILELMRAGKLDEAMDILWDQLEENLDDWWSVWEVDGIDGAEESKRESYKKLEKYIKQLDNEQESTHRKGAPVRESRNAQENSEDNVRRIKRLRDHISRV